jgi:hypothetical protein
MRPVRVATLLERALSPQPCLRLSRVLCCMLRAVSRGAEQRARQARAYDRTRQRFQRALQSAEELEGADSSVFAAVGRKGQQATAAAGAALPEGATAADDGSVADSASNPFLASGVEAAGHGEAAAAPGAAAVEDGEEAEDDVFDPAGWDDEVRKQWDAFVSSSKVRRVASVRLCLLRVSCLHEWLAI